MNELFISNRWISLKRLTMGSTKPATSHGSNDTSRKRITRTIRAAKPKPKPRVQPKPKPGRWNEQLKQ